MSRAMALVVIRQSPTRPAPVRSICRVALSWESAYGSGYLIQTSSDGAA